MTRITLTPTELAVWNAARKPHPPLTMAEANGKLAAMEAEEVAIVLALIRELVEKGRA